MNIEIRRAGFINKGSALMIHAVLQRMGKQYPDATFVMAPSTNPSMKTTPYHTRAGLHLFQKAWFWRYGVQWGDLAVLLPKNIRTMYGIVLDKEIDVVIDIAGYLYSDHWGDKGSLELAAACKRWYKQGSKVILMPQALGPFTSPAIRKAINTIVDNSTLIFPRERISYQNLIDVVGERPNIVMASDFTNLLQATPPVTSDDDKKICIVPNFRMLDKTTKTDGNAYLPFMIECTKYLLSKDAKPFFLLHEGSKDYELMELISAAVDADVPIVVEEDPLKIKGILANCNGMLGSRFHGLVSALSQGIPAIATGWNYKYQMLFEDYGFPEGLLSVHADLSEIKKKLDLIIEPDARLKLQRNILKKSDQLKIDSEDMWQRIFSVMIDPA